MKNCSRKGDPRLMWLLVFVEPSKYVWKPPYFHIEKLDTWAIRGKYRIFTILGYPGNTIRHLVGGHCHGISRVMEGLFHGKSHRSKWMMTGGIPYDLGNLHTVSDISTMNTIVDNGLNQLRSWVFIRIYLGPLLLVHGNSSYLQFPRQNQKHLNMNNLRLKIYPLAI